MTFLAYISAFGAISVIFLWFRDVRIFIRTSYDGYRKASYLGVVLIGLSSLGVFFSMIGYEFIGLGIVYGALYLHGRIKRERIWTNEGTLARLFGSCSCKKDKGKKNK